MEVGDIKNSGEECFPRQEFQAVPSPMRQLEIRNVREVMSDPEAWESRQWHEAQVPFKMPLRYSSPPWSPVQQPLTQGQVCGLGLAASGALRKSPGPMWCLIRPRVRRHLSWEEACPLHSGLRNHISCFCPGIRVAFLQLFPSFVS